MSTGHIRVELLLTNGTVERFAIDGRARTEGDRRLEVRYEVGFVVVVNEYGDEWGYPAWMVRRVETKAGRRG